MSIYSLDWWKGVITYGTSGDQVCDIIASWEVDHASLESQLASRDALVERLVEAGTMVLAYSLPMNETGAKWRMAWQPLVAEYRASKDGGGE